MIQFGYACLALGVADTGMKSCTMRTAKTERLREIIGHNLGALMRLVEYNQENKIKLFRISSNLIPFGSSPVNTLCWQDEFAKDFEEIGKRIAKASLRVSMHPGQYTVINSPHEDVVSCAMADLEYHEQVLRLLQTDNTGKLILHIGGVYGDKTAAMERFCHNWESLSDNVRSRIVLENDERSYNISDVLYLAKRLGAPAVLDTLHHAINPPEEKHEVKDWMLQCAKTWKPSDGRQKIHYSQQSLNGKSGAHSKTIYTEEFQQFYKVVQNLDLDIMLEVKDKNLSAIKCATLAFRSDTIAPLEREWAKYKYSVLEHSPKAYLDIRALLKNKNEFPAELFYNILEQAMEVPMEINNAVNGMLHVWGYFKNLAGPEEKKRFFTSLDNYRKGRVKAATVKNQLYKLATVHNKGYLLDSYYFL